MKKLFFSITFLKFGFVAGLSIVFELGLYTSLFELFTISPLAASPIAQIASMIFNFSLNKLFTFEKTGKSIITEFVGYFSVWLLNLLITTILMGILLAFVDIYPTIIRAGVIILMFFVNFTLLSKIVFNKKM